MLIAASIFLLTITLVIWQPRGLGVGWSAMLGAGLALLSGVVHLSDIPLVWEIIWNATATFVALIIISLLLDEAGQEAWLAADTSPSELQALLARPPLAMRERVLANLVNDPKLDAPECLTPA